MSFMRFYVRVLTGWFLPWRLRRWVSGVPVVGWRDPRSWAGENISGIPADLVAGLRMLPLHRCCGLARFWAIKKHRPCGWCLVSGMRRTPVCQKFNLICGWVASPSLGLLFCVDGYGGGVVGWVSGFVVPGDLASLLPFVDSVGFDDEPMFCFEPFDERFDS